MYKTKEKLYEAGKNEFLKMFDEIPEIDECEFFELKDSCDELYYDYENYDDEPRIKTVEWTRDYCLQYKDTIYYDSMKEEITMTIRYDEDGRLYDVVAGQFLVVGLTEDNFGSLTDEQIKKYSKMFRYPERFFKVNDEIKGIPFNPKNKEYER